MKTIKVGLVQMRCEKGAIDANLEAISHTLAAAAARSTDILGFPEMSITGYVDPTRYPGAVLRLDGPEIAQLFDMTRGQPTTLLAGLVEANPHGKPFITQVAVRDGNLLGYYRKLTIEDEEAEWFSPGDTVPVFGHDTITFGIAICADLGNREVFAECARQGARIVFELAAPGLYGEQATRDWRSGFEWWQGECQTHLSKYARDFGIWIAVATQAGRTVDEDFPGGGYLFAPDGCRLHATPDWSPGAIYLELDLETCCSNSYGSTAQLTNSTVPVSRS
jgi:predicted amidohydrolase